MESSFQATTSITHSWTKMDSTNDLRMRENMKKRQRKKEYKKNRNRNVIVPLIPVKVNQKEKKDIRK